MRAVEKLLARVNDLPFSPVAVKILEMVKRERAGVNDITKLIAQDQAFTARLLKIANSPYYGLARPVTTVAEAVPVLGFDTISSLALALDTFTSNAPDDGGVVTLHDLWEHSMSCACWARQIARRIGDPAPEEAFVAGLLHDMGQALLYRYFKSEFLEAVMRAWSENVSLLESERAAFGIDHQVAGALVARRWHLPDLLIHAIEYHERPQALPEAVDPRLRQIVAIVHAADVLTHGSQIGRGIEDDPGTVDDAVWRLLELDQPGCRELSERVMTEVDEFRKILGLPADPTLLRGHRKKLRGRPANRLAATSERTPPAKSGPRARAGLLQPTDGNAAAFARVIEAGKQLSLLAGLDDLYPNIAGQAMALLNADAAHLFLPRDKTLEIAGAVGLRELRGKRVPMEGSLAGWVARMGETVALPDIDKAADSWEKEYFKSVGLSAHLFLPVDWAGSRLAVLGLHGRKERHWTAREIALLNTFADFAAVALENARLYGEAEDRAKSLAQLNRELAEALHVKTRFLATVSHELRSPLFVITGYASLMNEQTFGPLPPGITDAAAKIIKQSDTLVGVITMILEISQLDAGTFVCHPGSFDLKALLDEIAQQAERLIGGKPIAFEARYDEDFLPIVTDRERLSQILGHILNNAAKFTQEGKIVLGAAPAQGGIEIVVEDTGIGIDPECQKIIFEDFRQIEQEANRAYEGMGLGLYYSRRVIELLGGRISVDSELGKGSRFHLWLPDGASLQSAQQPS